MLLIGETTILMEILDLYNIPKDKSTKRHNVRAFLNFVPISCEN